VLLTTGQELPFDQDLDHVTIRGLPVEPPTELFPVIRLECDGPPRARPWAVDRLWRGDPGRMVAWAAARGTSVYVAAGSVSDNAPTMVSDLTIVAVDVQGHCPVYRYGDDFCTQDGFKTRGEEICPVKSLRS
jgi:hypothetical protein